MEVERLYLDSNVLISLGEGRDEIAFLLTELAIGQKPSQRSFLCTSELTLAEVLVKPYRDEDERLIRRYENWIVPGGFLDVGRVDSSVLRDAAALRANYRSIKLPDAIHLSTAMEFGCSHFLTGDTRIPVRIELPRARQGTSYGRAAIDVVQPEADRLRQIIEAQHRT